MRPPGSEDTVAVVDHVYALLAANDHAAADAYVRQAVHIGHRPCNILIEFSRREPLIQLEA